MRNGKMFPFTLVVNDPLSNSFVGPKPADAARLAVQAEKEDSAACYQDFNDEGVTIVEYARTEEQNETLGLDFLQTEGYQGGAEGVNHGTDKPQELSNRFAAPHKRGLDHPFPVAKAPVEGDDTVMGEGTGSTRISLPVRRGEMEVPLGKEEAAAVAALADPEGTAIALWEKKDDSFEPGAGYSGKRARQVFKKGVQGIGYYADRKAVEVEA